ncbi:MAG: TIGR03086 family metal-binding protein [Chloroflexota bacterium]|nr:TIGR03086 family metal-binding protein [Chloroflexota bacterium]
MTTDSTPPMEDRGKLFSQAIDTIRAVAANVSGDQWDAQSPCTEWTARDVVNHVVGGSSMLALLFEGKSWAEASGGSASIPEGSDPVEALDAAAGAAKAAVARPGAMEQEVQFARGPMPGAGFATMMFTDILIHTWDLAKATGQDATLPSDLVDASYAIVLPRKGQMPQPAFAPEVEMPDDADTQSRLLGMLGRDPDWTG